MKLYKIIFCLGILTALASGCASRKNASDKLSTRQSGTPTATPSTTKQGTEPTEIITIRGRFLDAGPDSTAIFLQVRAYDRERPIPYTEFVNTHSLNFVIYSDYGSRDRLGYGNISLASNTVPQADGQLLISFKAKKPSKATGVMLAEISNSTSLEKSLIDLPIRFKDLHFRDKFGVFDSTGKTLVFENYVRNDQKIQIKSLAGESANIEGKFYKNAFDLARSPMNVSPAKNTLRNLAVDSTFSLELATPLSLTNQGLYYFEEDTAKAGLGLLVMDDRFPKVTRPKNLLGPIQYMSTNQEISSYKDSENSKKSLDSFWLTLMNGNQDLARAVIRNFYHNVEEANRLFTGYKEGWKTDRGMIFIVLGNPDKVQRSKDKEVWVYDRVGNAKNLIFTFNKRENQFVGDHYELVRYIEYQQIWFPIVEAWRNGTIR